MRLPVLFVLAAATAGGVAIAGGKVVRIDHPPSREVFVPAGPFWMGVSEDDIKVVVPQCSMFFEPEDRLLVTRANTLCGDWMTELERMPQRQVFLSAFAIDRDEVSVTEYRKCVIAGVCSIDPLSAGDERYIQDEWPIVNITWSEAQEFCRWRGARLPTEAEWERAARGDEPDKFRAAEMVWPWCDEMIRNSTKSCVERPEDFNHGQPRAQAMRDIDRNGNNLLFLMGDPDDVDGFALIAPPGKYAWGQGPHGTRDQAGNVAEWTADVRTIVSGTSTGYGGVQGCTEGEDADGEGTILCINPKRDGADTDPRIVRGGSWRQPSFISRSNLRDPYGQMYDPRRRFSHVGFRCARSVDK